MLVLPLLVGNDTVPAISSMTIAGSGLPSWTWKPRDFTQATDILTTVFENEPEDKGLSTGALTGIIVAGVAVVVGVIGGLVWMRRSRARRQSNGDN